VPNIPVGAKPLTWYKTQKNSLPAFWASLVDYENQPDKHSRRLFF
jgi:hypothetical protein